MSHHYSLTTNSCTEGQRLKDKCCATKSHMWFEG